MWMFSRVGIWVSSRLPIPIDDAGICVRAISEFPLDEVNPNFKFTLAPADPDLGRGVIGSEWGVDEDTKTIQNEMNMLAKFYILS